MNLWFRLIWMVLTARLRGKVQLFDTSVLRMRVMPNDLDLNGHVNNGRYFTLADLGRLDFVIRTGAARVAIANRAFPLIGDAVAKFRKDLKLFQRYDLQSRLLGWDDKWFFMEQRFVRGDDTWTTPHRGRTPFPKNTVGWARACPGYGVASTAGLGTRLASEL